MRVTLNLATRPFADLGPAIKRLRIGMGILALLAITLGLGLRALHQKAEEARARAEARLKEKITPDEVALVQSSLTHSLAQLKFKRRGQHPHHH